MLDQDHDHDHDHDNDKSMIVADARLTQVTGTGGACSNRSGVAAGDDEMDLPGRRLDRWSDEMDECAARRLPASKPFSSPSSGEERTAVSERTAEAFHVERRAEEALKQQVGGLLGVVHVDPPSHPIPIPPSSDDTRVAAGGRAGLVFAVVGVQVQVQVQLTPPRTTAPWHGTCSERALAGRRESFF